MPLRYRPIFEVVSTSTADFEAAQKAINSGTALVLTTAAAKRLPDGGMRWDPQQHQFVDVTLQRVEVKHEQQRRKEVATAAKAAKEAAAAAKAAKPQGAQRKRAAEGGGGRRQRACRQQALLG